MRYLAVTFLLLASCSEPAPDQSMNAGPKSPHDMIAEDRINKLSERVAELEKQAELLPTILDRQMSHIGDGIHNAIRDNNYDGSINVSIKKFTDTQRDYITRQKRLKSRSPRSVP